MHYIKDLLKITLVHILALFVVIGIISAYAAIPGGAPSGEQTNGLFEYYFQKIYTKCPNKNGQVQVLAGFDSNKNPICIN